MTSNIKHCNKDTNIYDIFRNDIHQEATSTIRNYIYRVKYILPHNLSLSSDLSDLKIQDKTLCLSELNKTKSALIYFSTWYKIKYNKALPTILFEKLEIPLLYQEDFIKILKTSTNKAKDVYIWKLKVLLYLMLFYNPDLEAIQKVTPNKLVSIIKRNHVIQEQEFLLEHLNYPFPSRIPFFNNESAHYFYRLIQNQSKKILSEGNNLSLKIVKNSFPTFPQTPLL